MFTLKPHAKAAAPSFIPLYDECHKTSRVKIGKGGSGDDGGGGGSAAGREDEEEEEEEEEDDDEEDEEEDDDGEDVTFAFAAALFARACCSFFHPTYLRSIAKRYFLYILASCVPLLVHVVGTPCARVYLCHNLFS